MIKIKKLKNIINLNKKPVYSHDLKSILGKLDINPGDIIILHASLSSFGYLVGSEQTLIETLVETIGINGTLIMPSQTINLSPPETWQYPPVPPEWYNDIRKYTPAYNPKKTISTSIGIVSNYFCMYPDVIRSDHPLYSFAALGKYASYLMSNHNLDYGLGPDSPLGKMYNLNSKVLMLGTDFETNTSLHLAEYYLNRNTISEEAPIMVNNQKQWVRFKNIPLDIYDDFLVIQKAFFEEYPTHYKEVSLYNGSAISFYMKDCVDFAIKYYKLKEKL